MSGIRVPARVAPGRDLGGTDGWDVAEVEAPARSRRRDTARPPAPRSDPLKDALSRGLQVRRPVMFFAVLQRGRWPPGPA